MTSDSRIYAQMSTLVALRHRAKGFSFLPSQPVGSVLSGRNRSKLRGRGLDFEELRQYRQGDDIRALDWRVTKRTKKPHIRVYNEEREHSVLLLIDQRMSMFFGSKNKMKSVVASEVAALCAWQVLSTGDRIGAVVFNDDEAVEIKPRRSERGVMQILHQTVKMNKALNANYKVNSNDDQLNVALQKASELCRHDALIILISDLQGWDDNTVKYIKRLSAHNDFIVPFVHDALEKELPPQQRLVVSDGFNQIAVDSGHKGLQQDFQSDFASNISYLQTELKKYAVPVIEINTDVPVVDQILLSLGQARKRGSK